MNQRIIRKNQRTKPERNRVQTGLPPFHEARIKNKGNSRLSPDFPSPDFPRRSARNSSTGYSFTLSTSSTPQHVRDPRFDSFHEFVNAIVLSPVPCIGASEGRYLFNRRD